MDKISTNRLNDAELDAVTGGGKNYVSVTLGGKCYEPTLVDIFVEAFRSAGGTGGTLTGGAAGGCRPC